MPSNPIVCQTPVLFLIHRRLELARQVLSAIRQVRPVSLLVAADGPEEDDRCQQTRSMVLREIDWPCEIETRFATDGLGCRKAVSQALDWGFSLHDRLIVIEDDCLPHVAFFQFCTELLYRYENQPEVMQICGCNETGHRPQDGSSYFASRFPSIWGWASWRRAWSLHDPEMKSWPEQRESREWSRRCRFPGEVRWRTSLYDAGHDHRVDAWSIAWNYAQNIAGGISLIPTNNLITNLGWAPDALHTRDMTDPRARMTTRDAGFPLRHPEVLSVDDSGDFCYFSKHCRRPSLLDRIKRKLARLSAKRLQSQVV